LSTGKEKKKSKAFPDTPVQRGRIEKRGGSVHHRPEKKKERDVSSLALWRSTENVAGGRRREGGKGSLSSLSIKEGRQSVL